MKLLYFFLLLLTGNNIFAQYHTTVIIKDSAAGEKKDIFMAGNFNGWKENDTAFKLHNVAQNLYSITLKNIAAGTISFKCMHSKWDEVEIARTGEDVPNHELAIAANDTIQLTIYNWKNGKQLLRKHTASAQVYLADTSFYIPQLKRYRRIWIYLPQQYYKNNTEKFSVLYMQDGQNLFDDFTAPFGEWGIDECMDTLQKKLHRYAIVVGIDHGDEKRLTEYNPYDNDKYGKGDGTAYSAFIVNTLKPFIDKHYRTFKDAKHTAIAGSSMGALISHYIIIKYPQTFAVAGIFSPAYWIAPKIYADTKNAFAKKRKHRFYFYCGDRESDSMQIDKDKMISILSENKKNGITNIFSPGAMHNEAAWKKQFAAFYTWWAKEW